jgi:DNA-binding MarR family transcriptional regulator
MPTRSPTSSTPATRRRRTLSGAAPARRRKASPGADLDPITTLETFWPFRLGVVANRVSQSIARIIDRKFGLHIPEWRMLVALANHAPCSANEVATLTSMDRARVSRAQQRLVDLKLITAMEDPVDKRRVVLRLTDEGRRITAAIVPDALRTGDALLEVLDAEERRFLDRILEKLLSGTQGLTADEF